MYPYYDKVDTMIDEKIPSATQIVVENESSFINMHYNWRATEGQTLVTKT